MIGGSSVHSIKAINLTTGENAGHALPSPIIPRITNKYNRVFRENNVEAGRFCYIHGIIGVIAPQISSMSAPRPRSFRSMCSYPRIRWLMLEISVVPSAISAAITMAAPARKSVALTRAPER